MPIVHLTDMRDLLIAVRKHVEENPGHTVGRADNPSAHVVGFQCLRCPSPTLESQMWWQMDSQVLGQWLRSCSSAPHRQVIMMIFGTKEGRTMVADLLNMPGTMPVYLLVPFEKQAGRATTAPTIWERLDDEEPV